MDAGDGWCTVEQAWIMGPIIVRTTYKWNILTLLDNILNN